MQQFDENLLEELPIYSLRQAGCKPGETRGDNGGGQRSTGDRRENIAVVLHIPVHFCQRMGRQMVLTPDGHVCR